MSNQYPGQPGQPGEIPPTQVAPGNVPPPQPGAPQGYPQGYPQQPQQPPTPYGAPGGGGFPPPPPFGAPPTGGGGGKKVALILGLVGFLVLVLVAVAVLFWPVGLLLDDDGDGDGDGDRPTVTQTITQETSDATTAPTTDLTTDLTTTATDTSAPTTDGSTPSTEDAEITAMAYLNSLLEGNCLAVEGLSTPEWFSSAYGSQRGCKRAGGNQDMSTAVYDEFQAPVDNGDGTITLVATVTDSTDGTSYTATWILTPSDDNATWLVDGFQLA